MNGPDLPDPRDVPDTAAGGDVDPIDELLRARIHTAAAEPTGDVGADAELAELAPRFRRARQRRQAAVVALSSAAAAVLLIVGVVAVGGEDAQRLDTAGEDDRVTTSTTVPATTSTTSVATTSTTVPDTAVTTPSTTTSIAGSTDGGNGSGGAPPAPTTTTPPPAPTAPPTTAAVGGVETLVAEGGTATVRWSADGIVVLSTAPATGWSLEQVEQRSPTRVVVEFRRDGGGQGSSNSTIDARVVDGRLDVNS